MAEQQAPLVVHIIYRLCIGGLENGLVNLINQMPPARYRHAIICLTDATDFRQRIRRPDVAIYELHKRPGQDWGMQLRLWRLLKTLRPALVHTRNLATLECQVAAYAAGVQWRVHGEHGWDVHDPDGSNRKYQWLRRLIKPLIHRFIALSSQQEHYLQAQIRVPAARRVRICNGVDSARFQPAVSDGRAVLPAGFAPPGTTVIGAVGRMQAIKDPLNLLHAFLHLRRSRPDGAQLRLVLIGDGPLRETALTQLTEADAADCAWLPGARDDVPELLRALDLFVLPSQAEGISNTLLEAMACGLPVVATRVGGNADLVVEQETGVLVPAADSAALAVAIGGYLDHPARLRAHGQAGRRRIEQQFALAVMVQAYLAVYDQLIR